MDDPQQKATGKAWAVQVNPISHHAEAGIGRQKDSQHVIIFLRRFAHGQNEDTFTKTGLTGGAISPTEKIARHSINWSISTEQLLHQTIR